MSTQARRKSNIFTSLRQRTSFRDLHSQLKPLRSFTLGEKPLPLKPLELNAASRVKKTSGEKAVPEQSAKRNIKPETPTNDAGHEMPKKSLAKEHALKKDLKQTIAADAVISPGNGDKSDASNKRLSVSFKTKASPSSEKTLTTVASQSDIGSLDTLFIDNHPMDDTFAGDEPLADNIKHLSYTGYIDMDFDEPCTPAMLRRTTNFGNINKFVSKDGIVPISNRASLELEAKEIERFTSKVAKASDDNFSVQLIENAFTMTFFQSDCDGPKETRYWDDLDFTDALKSDWDSSLDPLVL